MGDTGGLRRGRVRQGNRQTARRINRPSPQPTQHTMHQVNLPAGVEYEKSTVLLPKNNRSLKVPTRAASALNWTSLTLVPKKTYSFKVKLNVTACPPSQLTFSVLVGGGGCNVASAPATGTVKQTKRSKKATTCPPYPPLPPDMSNYTILPQKGFFNEGSATIYINTSVELHTNVESCNTFCLTGAYGQIPKCEWCSFYSGVSCICLDQNPLNVYSNNDITAWSTQSTPFPSC